MSYRPRSHEFLYHAHALALGGWVRDRNRQFTALPALAPSVLSITGGYASNSESHINFYTPGQYLWGEGGPKSFQLYVGHAYTEVRGSVEDDDHPFGAYQTTVRSVLDDVRINDVFYVEHAEAVLRSTHPFPGERRRSRDPVTDADADPEMSPDAEVEPAILVGESNMSGVRVLGTRVGLTKHAIIDDHPTYSDATTAAANSSSPFSTRVCNWRDPDTIPDTIPPTMPPPAPGRPNYAHFTAKINQNSHHHLRYSVFEDIVVPTTDHVRTVKTSVEVDDFGRIFFGEVTASKRTKHVTMFRIDLGCDNCGGIGGSGGTTNGGPMP
jgi:hypothetical protein